MFNVECYFEIRCFFPGGGIVRGNCVGMGFRRNTGVFYLWNRCFIFSMGNRHGNRPTELIKSHDFVFGVRCRMLL